MLYKSLLKRKSLWIHFSADKMVDPDKPAQATVEQFGGCYAHGYIPPMIKVNVTYTLKEKLKELKIENDSVDTW